MKAAQKTASELVRNIENDSPARTGKYKKGWSVKRRDGVFIAYNKNKPSLAHLLEFGHNTRNGSRARAYKHIKENEKEANEKFVKRCKAIISGEGGDE